MKIKVKKLREKAVLPFRATEASAGADLYCCIDEAVCIAPGERKLVPTGIAVQIPEGCGGFVFPRSGSAIKKGLSMANAVGVIDSDYRGELCVPLINLGSEPIVIENGERIAQLVIIPVELCGYEESDTLDETARGLGGFGSTGTK